MSEFEDELRRRLSSTRVHPDPDWVARLRDDLVADLQDDRPVAAALGQLGAASRSRRALSAVATGLVAAAVVALFFVTRAGREDVDPARVVEVRVEVPTADADGNRVAIATSLGRVVWTRVTAPFGPVASSADGLFSVYVDAGGVMIRRYDAAAASWLNVSSVGTLDRLGGLGRIESDRDLYFFSIDADCADLALGDGGLAPSPGAERCLGLERSDDGGLTFERSPLDMPDPFVPRAATITSAADVALLDAVGVGRGDHRYWATKDGRTWRMVELPWSNQGRAPASRTGSIVSDRVGLIAYTADGSAAWRSLDGATWTPVEQLSGLPTSVDGVAVTRTSGEWLAVASNTVHGSRDGVDWQEIGPFPDVTAKGSTVAAFGAGAVIAPADMADCVEHLPAAVRVTADGITWYEVFGAGEGRTYPGFTVPSGTDRLCIQIAADAIVIESPAGMWLGRLETGT